MANIRKHIVKPSIAAKVTYGGTNPKKYIVIHETANTSKGANADAHGRLQAGGNSRSASWHYTVDDKEIVQSFEDSAQCWHAGNAKYNRESIGIEICVNAGGDFRKAVENAAELTRYLMTKYNIPAANVIQHNAASGKNCPANLRSGKKGVKWSDFISMVKGNKVVETKVQGVSNKPKPQPQSKPKVNLSVDGKWGPSTTEALQKALSTPVDGIISSQPKNSVTNALYGGVTWGKKGSPMVKALQNKIGAKADGKLGPETVRKLQQYLGTPVDGVISRPTSVMVKELQRRLNKGNF